MPQMIEIAMLPSIVRETAVMIRSDIRLQRSEPRGSSSVSTAPISRGRSIIRNNVRKIAVTSERTRLNPEMMTPRTPPAAPAMPWAISLAFAEALSGAVLLLSTHEPIDELLLMSSMICGSWSTKSWNVPTSGESRSRTKTTPSAISPRMRVVAHAPRPIGSFRCIPRTTGSKTSARKSERNRGHDDFGDVDERPRERDEERDEQHRAHRDVDVHRP